MKKFPFLNLKQANSQHISEIKDAVCKVIDSGIYLHGEETATLENEIANLCQTKFCVALSNGLDALRLIIRAYKEEGKFIQFAMRIAHNLIIDHFRKSNRLPMADSVNKDYDIMDNVRLSDPSVEDSMVNEQVYADLRKMIDNLPDEQKEVVNMRMYADMSFKEIAEATNVSINTALGRMRYALINLRKMAEEHNLTLTLNNF